MLKGSIANIGKMGNNTPTSVGPTGPSPQARASLIGKNPYKGPVPKEYAAAPEGSYGPAYKDGDNWFRPAYWHGQQPQEYLDWSAKDRQEKAESYEERLRKRRLAEEARIASLPKGGEITGQHGEQYLGGEGSGRPWGTAQNRTGYDIRLPLPQIDDTYQRMGKPDYEYENDSPRTNSNAGALSAAYSRNTSGLMAGLLGDSARGVSDLQGSMNADEESKINHDAQTRDAAMGVPDNSLEQAGLTQQANLYGQINERATSQMGLAQQMQSARLKDQMAQVNSKFARYKGKYSPAMAQRQMAKTFDEYIRKDLFATG
jgi:hypothetical protein